MSAFACGRCEECDGGRGSDFCLRPIQDDLVAAIIKGKCAHPRVTHFASIPTEAFLAFFSGRITAQEFEKMDLEPRNWTRCDVCKKEWDR